MVLVWRSIYQTFPPNCMFPGKSLLERLMDLDIYQGGHENYITMLKLNFRSHPLILQIPNKLFYDDQLLVSFCFNFLVINFLLKRHLPLSIFDH